MTRGRRPKPAELKERIGNPGRRSLPPEATEVPAVDAAQVSTKVPEGLTGDAAKIWLEMVPGLALLRFVKITDMQALKRYCVWLARWWQASQDVENRGSYYETSSPHVEKMLRLNPAFSVMVRAEKQCQDLEDRFGFNPAARMRIAAALASNPSRDRGLPGLGAEEPEADEAGEQIAPAAPTKSSPIGILSRGAVH